MDHRYLKYFCHWPIFHIFCVICKFIHWHIEFRCQTTLKIAMNAIIESRLLIMSCNSIYQTHTKHFSFREIGDLFYSAQQLIPICQYIIKNNVIRITKNVSFILLFHCQSTTLYRGCHGLKADIKHSRELTIYSVKTTFMCNDYTLAMMCEHSSWKCTINARICI